MAKIPKQARTHHEVERRIHAALEEERTKRRSSSNYVWLSGIGKCQRALWAARQGTPDERPPLGRALMTFDLGNKVEDVMIEWLRAAGYEVISHGPDGDQWRVEMPGRVAAGRLDGIIRWGHPRDNDLRLLEVKSAKASRFDLLVEAGSYDTWNPEYGDQICAYMGASHTMLEVPDLRECLVLVFSKDDSRIWSEMIRFDADRYQALVEKARIAMGDEMPERPKPAKSHGCKYCKWCGVNAWCWSPMAGISFDN